jgi:uncharacterized protein (DUF608 family)
MNSDLHFTKETCGNNCECGTGMERREFVKVIGLSALALGALRMPVMAGPFEAADFEKLVPADKKLDSQWVKSLFERGVPTVYSGADLKYIGMPVGGICAGQLYLGGDGKLWLWDIFNQHRGTGDKGYAHPAVPSSLLQQAFTLKIGESAHPLDGTGFSEVTFMGQYPIAGVSYKDPAVPLTVKLEAFSPFIPLNTDDSSLPATVMQFTVQNTSGALVEAELTGSLENAVCLYHRQVVSVTRRNRIIPGTGFTFLECSAEKADGPVAQPAPDIVFEDWSKDGYGGWTDEGTAFGRGPVKKSDIPAYQQDVGGDTPRVVNSHATAPGKNIGEKDDATGKLTSRPFTIERNLIMFWIGGGNNPGKTCLNLIVDGKVARSATGKNNNRMEMTSFDVRELKGKQALIEIVDDQSGAWGNIGVGRILFSDRDLAVGQFDQLPDYGTMGLALLGDKADVVSAEKSVPLREQLVGELGRRLKLEPGHSTVVTFAITWFFPNLENKGIGTGRYYSGKYDSALAVARHLAGDFERLATQTRLWRDTWYDSTLPYWFLDRTFLNTSILATSTCQRYKDGRFWGWEGVGCCKGTCTHVWHYAHAMARNFPDIERDMRERVDLGLALNLQTGVSGFRAENDRGLAVDGQSGTILRMYREHQMSGDGSFLKRNWSKIKLMFDPLFKLDPEGDGVLQGAQMNTLDRPWYGSISWLSSMYLAALRAGEAMAAEMGEPDFAERCKSIVEKGSRKIDKELFNGEYYYQVGDPSKPGQVGCYDGCEIDQMLGQSWVFQVGLNRILPVDHTRTALGSLWKYNFTPDAGAYRAVKKPGRWYAMAGEAGLLMCTWPRGEEKRVPVSFDYYFNECMNGFEHQVAGHMIWEGMVQEGLAIERAVHDRYHASKRNPWNEIECGDHYARSMASYGVFLAACGYEYHGPNGHLGFAPRLSPEDFKAAFTTAAGWGTFSQQVKAGVLSARVTLAWGSLRLKTLALALPQGSAPAVAKVTVNGVVVDATKTIEGSRIVFTLAADAKISAGQTIEVTA